MPESRQKFCPICGALLRGSSTRCDNCGGEATEARQPVAAEVRTAEAGRKKTQAQPTSGGRRPSARIALSKPALAALLAAVAVLSATVGYVIGAGVSAEPSEAQQASQAPAVDLAALNSLRENMERNPGNADAILKYANALHDAKLVDQAIARYRDYLAMVPDDADAGIDLGVCYFERRDHDAAIAQMESVLARHPDHQLGNFNLGIVNYSAGNAEAAAKWFRKTIELNPGSQVAENARRMMADIGQPGG